MQVKNSQELEGVEAKDTFGPEEAQDDAVEEGDDDYDDDFSAGGQDKGDAM